MIPEAIAIGDSVLGAATHASKALGWIRRRRMRRLLGTLSNPSLPVNLYLREMDQKSGKFTAREPHKSPSLPDWQTIHHYQNIPEVYGLHDVKAAILILNLLSQSGKGTQVVCRSPRDEWNQWSSADVVSIGGHDVTWRILERFSPRVVEYIPNETFRVGNQSFVARLPCDYGLICRGFDPLSNRTFLVVVGIGGLGTEAAARFLFTRAGLLARLFPRTGFSILVRASWNDHAQLVQPVWSWPEPTGPTVHNRRCWTEWNTLRKTEIPCYPLAGPSASTAAWPIPMI